MKKFLILLPFILILSYFNSSVAEENTIEDSILNEIVADTTILKQELTKNDSIALAWFGVKAPSIVLVDFKTNIMTYLSDYTGIELRRPYINKIHHIVIISFFATYCKPCRKEIPLLQETIDELQKEGIPIKLFFISVDASKRKKELKKYITETNITYPVLWDRYQKRQQKYKVENIPSLFVIDKWGFVRFVHIGYKEGIEQEVKEVIHHLLENYDEPPEEE